MNQSNRDNSRLVEEFQGLYGPYHVSEKLVQKIWLNAELNLGKLATDRGEKIRVFRRGDWNLLDGPDFIGADIEIDGRRLVGDIEIHFRQSDWFGHGHQKDPAYDRVVLHLVLFPPRSGSPHAVTSQGREIETAVLLDLLWHDLEEYAVNDAAADMAQGGRGRILERLLGMDLSQRRNCLFERARKRWRTKVHFAGIRIARLGWAAACHATVLEVLGYGRNRSAMLMVADRYPLEIWTSGQFDVGSVLEDPVIPWRKKGVRPANSPKTRLGQYAQLAVGRPDWVARLASWSGDLPPAQDDLGPIDIRKTRASLGVTGLRRTLIREVLAGAVRAPRADTVAADALLPLVAAQDRTDLFPCWFCWPPGDMPTGDREVLRRAQVAGIERSSPYCHGWFQGLLDLILEDWSAP